MSALELTQGVDDGDDTRKGIRGWPWTARNSVLVIGPIVKGRQYNASWGCAQPLRRPGCNGLRLC